MKTNWKYKVQIYPEECPVTNDPTEWRWRITSRNGKIVASGEAYKNKRDCVKSVAGIVYAHTEELFVLAIAALNDPLTAKGFTLGAFRWSIE